MLLLFLDSIFANEMVNALFSTFVRSLWIGAAMALLAGIIILLTKRSKPLVRYHLLTGLLLSFVAAMGYVFYEAISADATAIDIANANQMVTAADNITAQLVAPGNPEQGIIESIISFFTANAGTVVWIWFIVIMFKCIQLTAGLRGLYLLKHRNIIEAGAYWNGRMQQLATRIGVTKPIMLLQSSIAKVPMVIGHLKPVILFPVGILTALPPNEIEAILLHELAHIRRKDFLVNVLQHFAEIFFFFNPAVLWVSALIKNERENCCDDIAIAVTHNKKQFIHALVSFQEYNAGIATYATTFTGTKNHLLNRVKRIITNNNKTLNTMEKILLVAGIVITCMVTVAFSQKQTTDEKEAVTAKQAIKPIVAVDTTVPLVEAIELTIPLALIQLADVIKEINPEGIAIIATPEIAIMPEITVTPELVADTVPAIENKKGSSQINYTTTIDGKNYRLVEENNIVKEFYVEGKRIPDDQIDSYKPVIGKIHQQMKENMEKLNEQTELMKKNQSAMQKQAEIMKKNAEQMQEQSKKMQEDFKKQAELMPANQAAMQKQAEIMKKNAEQMQEQSKKMQEDFKKQAELMPAKQAEMQKQAELMKKNAEQMKEQAQKMEQDFKMQSDQMLKSHVEMQIQSEIMKKNAEQMKEQSQKMEQDFKKQQEEFIKKSQELRLQQEKINRKIVDSVKQSRIELKPSTFNIKPAL